MLAKLSKCDICGEVTTQEKFYQIQVIAAGKTWKDRKNYDVCDTHKELLTELRKLP